MKNFDGIFIGTATAQESSPPPTGQSYKGGSFGMFLPMILVFVIFYFLMIRPQQKQRKQHLALVQNLKKGDEVVTTAGIHGKIAGVADTVLTVEIAENVRIKMDKTQVASVKTAPSA